MDRLIIYIFTTIILLFIIKILISEKKFQKYKKHILNSNDISELKLMIGYNYISNLNKLESLINELIAENISKEKIDYMERIIDNTSNIIYNNKIKDKTICFENEFLYKDNVMNLDIIFYAFKKIINQIRINNYKSFDNNSIFNEKQFNHKINKLSKKGNKIVNSKFKKKYYYKRINKIKNDYIKIIDNSNPILLMFFIKDCIKNINESC